MHAGNNQAAMASMGKHTQGVAATPLHTLATPAQGCAHHVCAQAPVLPGKQRVVLGPLHADTPVATTSLAAVQLQRDRSMQFVRGPPLLRLSTPVSRHTTLLV